MKTFNASALARKRTEIFEAAKDEGAVLQKKNTNGDVLDEFIIISKTDEAAWQLYQSSKKVELNDI